MRKALLVVDMLNDFILPNGVLSCGSHGEAIVPFIKEKIAEFIDNDDAVILLCDRHLPDDLEFSRVNLPPHAIEDTYGAELVADLQFDGWEECVTGKQRYSGFFNTDLEEQLEEIDQVEVVGVCTNICVLFTVEELYNRDKTITVWQDGVASFDEAAHKLALKQMQSLFGVSVI